MRKIRVRPLLALAVTVALVTGCATAAKTPVPTVKAPAAIKPDAAAVPAVKAPAAAKTDHPAIPFTGKLALEPKSGLPGTEVTVKGTGLPTNAQFKLNWNTVDGFWVLKGDYNEEFHGREFKDRTVSEGTVKTDVNGDFLAKLKVPEGWGFDHDITVVDPATDQVVNKANFQVDMQVNLLNTSGPVGTPITLDVSGMGYRSLENSWVVLYDNKVTGWIASVTTGGKVRFTIPAAGAPGKHEIIVNHGWASVMYLNSQQSPTTGRRIWNFEFTVTPGDPVLPPPAVSQGLKPEPGAVPGGVGPALWTEPASGPVGTPVRLMGRGLTPGETVAIDWWRMSGNRIGGQGWAQSQVSVGKATVAPDGTIALSFGTPDDLGGSHRLEARVGDRVLATGSFTVTPSVAAVEPARGPVGTTFLVHLKGVGWTETANIYTLTYDNAYIGFACGFNTQGDVQIFLPAAGEPGWHFIDLYPAIYRGTDIPGVQNFRYPMLTGELDHPGERLPIFRLAFYVTG